MMTTEEKKLRLGIAGTIVSAMLTSTALLAVSCCAGPAVFLALGFGVASLSTFEFLAPYRWFLFSLTILLLAGTFVHVYLRHNVKKCESTCSISGNTRNMKILMWLIALLVIALVSFPFLFEKYLLQVK